MELQRSNHSFDEWKIDNISFGDLSNNELSDMFTDGRLASHFLERQLTKWYQNQHDSSHRLHKARRLLSCPRHWPDRTGHTNALNCLLLMGTSH